MVCGMLCFRCECVVRDVGHIRACVLVEFIFFFFNDPAPTEFYPLPLPDALPISSIRLTVSARPASSTSATTTAAPSAARPSARARPMPLAPPVTTPTRPLNDSTAVSLCYWDYARSEEHTSELQSQSNLVCRLLLE